MFGRRGGLLCCVLRERICRAMIWASSPIPNSREERRLRRKCTPQKYSPGSIVLAPSLVNGNLVASVTGAWIHP